MEICRDILIRPKMLRCLKSLKNSDLNHPPSINLFIEWVLELVLSENSKTIVFPNIYPIKCFLFLLSISRRTCIKLV